MSVVPLLERSALLLVDEILWTSVLAHACGHAPSDSQVPGLKSDAIAEREMTSSHPTDNMLAGAGHGCRVQLHI